MISDHSYYVMVSVIMKALPNMVVQSSYTLYIYIVIYAINK